MKLILTVVLGLAGASYLGTKGLAVGKRALDTSRQYHLVSARDGLTL